MGPMHANEVPFPLADVRLVIPYELTQRGVKSYSDVIVENIRLERHTRGIDPYTGTDYGDAEIPAEHQYDPQTGLPIFHRYIAGTQHRIEWPWEVEAEIEENSTTEESTADKEGFFKKTLSTIRHPITSLKSWRGKDKDTSSASTDAERSVAAELEAIESQATLNRELPRSKDPKFAEAYDVDTTRNIVEGAESMSYTLVAPPFPNSLSEELRGDIHDFSIEAKKDSEAPKATKTKRTSEAGIIAREAMKEKKRAADKMKTPMQLRWELEHAKKVSNRKKNLLVPTEDLLLALGNHMKKNGVKSKVEDLD